MTEESKTVRRGSAQHLSSANPPTSASPAPADSTSSTTNAQPRPQAAPAGLKLIREVNFGNRCLAVCHYKGFTYAGKKGGTIGRTDQRGNVTRTFTNLNRHHHEQGNASVISLAAYCDRLYILLYINRNHSWVFVYNLTDRSITHDWTHRATPFYGQRIAVLNDKQVAVGDRSSRQIVIYSLYGEVIRRVPCPISLSMIGNVSISSCGEGIVAISDKAVGTVVRMSLDESDLNCHWSSFHVGNPGGIAHHPGGVILVAKDWMDHAEICVLDENDGKFSLCWWFIPSLHCSRT